MIINWKTQINKKWFGKMSLCLILVLLSFISQTSILRGAIQISVLFLMKNEREWHFHTVFQFESIKIFINSIIYNNKMGYIIFYFEISNQCAPWNDFQMKLYSIRFDQSKLFWSIKFPGGTASYLIWICVMF